MKTVSERMLEYVRFNTQSNDSTGRHPSTPGQLEFARHLAKELRELGVERVRVSEFAYVFGEIPPSAGCGEAPALGLVAHMDTSADAPGDNVRPQLVEYRGGVIPLGDSGRTLDPAVFSGTEPPDRAYADHHGRHHASRRRRQGPASRRS